MALQVACIGAIIEDELISALKGRLQSCSLDGRREDGNSEDDSCLQTIGKLQRLIDRTKGWFLRYL
jgi:hypothetical protein